MEQNRKILITGANGFVGSALVRLMVARGLDVLPVVRTAPLESAPTSVGIGDMLDFDGWESLMSGVDVVVHLAAKVHQAEGVSEEEYRAANVDVTSKMAAAARRAGVRRIIYLSTVKVNGERTAAGEKFSGNDKPAPEDAYGRSKLGAEKQLQAMLAGSETSLVIIRPPLVYGPGVRANFEKLIRLAGLPFPLPFAAVRNRRDMVSVLNLCELITLCCSHPCATERVWMVADEKPYSLASLISNMRAVDGRSPGLFSVPLSLLKLLLVVLRMSSLSDRLFADLQVDIEPTKEMLEWHPVYSFSQTMAAVKNGSSPHE